MKIIRKITKEDHEQAISLTSKLIKNTISGRKGLNRDKGAANPSYTEEFGDIECRYWSERDRGDMSWNGQLTDYASDAIFDFKSCKTLSDARLKCVRVVRNRYAS